MTWVGLELARPPAHGSTHCGTGKVVVTTASWSYFGCYFIPQDDPDLPLKIMSRPIRSGHMYAECLWLDRARTNPQRYSLHGPQLARGRDR
jgi:hypothetical protein